VIYTDNDICKAIETGKIGYSPFRYPLVNPASIDMTLHPVLRVPNPLYEVLDMREVEPDHTDVVDLSEHEDDWYKLEPGDFILACTNEIVRLPNDIVARVEGKSSIGRVGLAVHITAGFIDPGFEGQVTLEIANLAPWSIMLRPGMRIAQIAFQQTTSAAKVPYGKVGHYQGQSGPTESRYKMDS
jgi:dCTP deaminase